MSTEAASLAEMVFISNAFFSPRHPAPGHRGRRRGPVDDGPQEAGLPAGGAHPEGAETAAAEGVAVAADDHQLPHVV